MDELLINLQTIKELRVPGRTSTEQYMNHPKPIPEIASEMNVAYIVEGSGLRYGDHIRLRVQLVEGTTDRYIWAKSYEEVIKGSEDIFRIQSEIAQLIAAELHAVTGQTEKALENLRIWIKRPDMPTNILIFLKYDPHLNPLRDNPEFQQIMDEAEDKFNAENERVRQWLEENEML